MNEAEKAELAAIAERIEEAFDTLARSPDSTRGRLGMQALSWPLMVRRVFEDAPRDVQTRRPMPDGRQIDRMHEVMGWMVMLAKVNRDYVTAVYLIDGRRRKVSEAARALGCDRKTVHRWRVAGLQRIAAWQARRKAGSWNRSMVL